CHFFQEEMADPLHKPGQPSHPEILVEQQPFEPEQALGEEHFPLKSGLVAGGPLKCYMIMVEKVGGPPQTVEKPIALKKLQVLENVIECAGGIEHDKAGLRLQTSFTYGSDGLFVAGDARVLAKPLQNLRPAAFNAQEQPCKPGFHQFPHKAKCNVVRPCLQAEADPEIRQ